MVAHISAQNTLEIPSYPRSWEFDGLLTSGQAVLVRPIQPADTDSLVAFHAQLVPETIYSRYFAVHPTMTRKEAAHFTEVDYDSRMAFIAIVADELVAFAGYDRLRPKDPAAEVAFVVADAYQGLGVATLLFESLASYARTLGIGRFVAEVLMENSSMLSVFGATGLGATRVNENGTVHVTIDLHPTPEYRAACDEREATAEVASMTSILRPRSIAVVGAGRSRGNAGHEVVRSLLAGDFTGTVYPVNPSARAICGVPAYPNLASLPEQIDLAIVAVPAAGVPGILGEAAASGVQAVTVVSAGFAETGRSGFEVENELLRTARRHGMRIVGPNCLGVVNTDPIIRMNATFAGLDPFPGRLALVSQSGAVGNVLAEQSSAAGLGLSSFVSIGNKLDVSSNDLLCFFEQDERTSVIALYLESFGNPRKFARIARRIGQHKPIVALKSGRTSAGSRGALSHTAAAATPEVTVTALLRDAGVIKVDRLEELLDVSAVLLSERLPAGRRVALVGNSGGPLILAADACEAGGLIVPEFDEPTRLALGEVLVPAAAITNPVDLTADGSPDTLETALEIALHDDAIDAVIVVVTELVALSGAEARMIVARGAERSEKLVVACILGEDAARVSRGALAVTEIPSPERAATALEHVCRYAEWRRRPGLIETSVEVFDNSKIREIVASALETCENGGWLDLEVAASLLEASGVPVLTTRPAKTVREAISIAVSIGFPVVLKARSGQIVHKSDVGGVVVGLDSATAVRKAYELMSAKLGTEMDGVVIQPMATPGVEAIIGLTADPVFGPLVMVGLGGVLTDLLGDHAFAVPPLARGAAEMMVSSLHASPLLDGYRGAPRVDRQALVGILETIGKLAEQVPELVELDLNPILVTPTGATVVDCKARLAPCHPGPGPLFRALRSPTRVDTLGTKASRISRT